LRGCRWTGVDEDVRAAGEDADDVVGVIDDAVEALAFVDEDAVGAVEAGRDVRRGGRAGDLVGFGAEQVDEVGGRPYRRVAGA
jgi:hypothetical protein